MQTNRTSRPTTAVTFPIGTANSGKVPVELLFLRLNLRKCSSWRRSRRLLALGRRSVRGVWPPEVANKFAWLSDRAKANGSPRGGGWSASRWSAALVKRTGKKAPTRTRPMPKAVVCILRLLWPRAGRQVHISVAHSSDRLRHQQGRPRSSTRAAPTTRATTRTTTPTTTTNPSRETVFVLFRRRLRSARRSPRKWLRRPLGAPRAAI